MRLSEISIQRPVLATVMSLLLVLFGFVSLSFLSVREYPDIDPPIVSVSTVYPGANAEIIETTVTERLEDELIGIEGIRSMTSNSEEGVSNIVIEFELYRNVDVASQDVRDRVSRARGRLPDDIEEPIIAKQDSDASAIMWLGLGGKGFSHLQVTDYADRYITDQLQTIPGVGRIIIGGAREYAMRVWLDPDKMAARGVTVLDVEEALRNENVEIPSGRIEGVTREFSVRTQGELKTPEQFNRLIIRRVNGAPVYMADIGYAEIGAENERSLVRFMGEPAVGLGIVKQSKANTLDVANEVKRRLSGIRETLPRGMTLESAYDSSVFIQRSIDEVRDSLFVAFALVVLVIFLFLKNWRATLVPAISIPISLVATFIAMYALGYTINTITLLGLTLAIGLVVDDNIVVLENIYRRMESGEPPMRAAIEGIKEIAFAVIATTAVLVAVFLPILFLQGTTGRLLREFAVVMAFSVVISSFVALTLAPMMCARILKVQTVTARQGLVSAGLDRFSLWLDNVSGWFERTLAAVMNRKRAVFAVVGVLVCVCSALYLAIPKEFLPTDDRSTILTFFQAPEGSTMAYTDKAVRKAEAIFRDVPEMRKMFSVIALSQAGAGQVNSGIMFVNLKPPEDRKRKQQQIVQSIFPQMMSIPEAFAFPNNPSGLPGGNSGSPIQMAILTLGDLTELDRVAQRVKERAQTEVTTKVGLRGVPFVGEHLPGAEIPMLMNLDSDLKLNKPQLEVEINRERASLLGVSVRDIARTLQIMLGSTDITTFQHLGKRYDVMVQALPRFRLTPDELNRIYVSGNGDLLVPLTNVVDYRESVTPKQLNHYNRQRSATISAALMPVPGVSLGDALTQLEQIAREEMAAGMNIAWKGEAKEYFDAGNATFYAFGLSLLVVFLVLAAQFESYRDPLIVMFTVPLAVAGALLTLFLLNAVPGVLKAIPLLSQGLAWWNPVSYPLNIYSQIGLVLLVGLVTKNGILIVEFANQIREQQPEKTASEAVMEATRIRFRPVLMTAISTIFGALPIAIGLGAGIDGRKPLGAVIVGGMLLATLLTLFIIPMMYDVFKRKTPVHVRTVPQDPALRDDAPVH